MLWAGAALAWLGERFSPGQGMALIAGDVLVLREGDRVPADARLFEASALKVDDSPLTGECEPQLRTVAIASGQRLDSRNLVFSGTLVTTGTGSGIVYATGDSTELGRIAGVTRRLSIARRSPRSSPRS